MADDIPLDFEIECPICRGRFIDRTIADGCDHGFCRHCIIRWLNVAHTCPVCRRPINRIFTIYRFRIDIPVLVIEVE